MDEDLYNSVRRQLGITATIYDETKEKFHADLRESYRREREQEKERYRNEIIGYHGSEEGSKHSSATSFSASETGQTVRHLPIKWTMYRTDT
ncbi:hypothetical protein NXX09_22515 [Bacteroides uniformis]|nr:hypothetical protein [Bacteroides uniformis]